MSLPQRKVAFFFCGRRQADLPLFWLWPRRQCLWFLQELEGLSFPESVLKVAEISDIPLDEQYKQTEAIDATSSQQNQLIALHEKAAEVYHHMLVNTAAGQGALDYLLERGLTMALIDEFQIGFAPNERAFWKKFLNEKANAAFLRIQVSLYKGTMGNLLTVLSKNHVSDSEPSRKDHRFFWTLVSNGTG